MKVIFLEHVVHVAKKGELKDVSSGYATNFLFPKNLAKPYTDTIKKKLEEKAHKQESERRLLLSGKEDILKKLSWEKLEFTLASKWWKAIWGIMARDIAEALKKKFKFPFSKKHIDLQMTHAKITTFGIYEIYVDLWENQASKIQVEISPQV